jgi:hypothetical protein
MSKQETKKNQLLLCFLLAMLQKCKTWMMDDDDDPTAFCLRRPTKPTLPDTTCPESNQTPAVPPK